jgi:hypothetical protein
MEDMVSDEQGMESLPSGWGASRDAWLVSGAILLSSVVISLALVFGGNFALKTDTKSPTKAADAAPAAKDGEVAVTQDQVKALFTDKNLAFGDKNSKVLFVEFSDPSCPYCGIAAGKNPNLNKQAGAQFLMAKDGGTYVPPVPEIKKLVDAGKRWGSFLRPKQRNCQRRLPNAVGYGCARFFGG